MDDILLTAEELAKWDARQYEEAYFQYLLYYSRFLRRTKGDYEANKIANRLIRELKKNPRMEKHQELLDTAKQEVWESKQ